MESKASENGWNRELILDQILKELGYLFQNVFQLCINGCHCITAISINQDLFIYWLQFLASLKVIIKLPFKNMLKLQKSKQGT